MKSNKLPLLFVVACLAASAGASTLRGFDGDTGSQSSGAEELDRLQARIQEVYKEAGVQRRSQQQRLREVEAEKRATSRTIRALESELAKVRKTQGDKNAEIAELEKKRGAIKSRNDAIKAVLNDHSASLRETVAEGIEWLKADRLKTVDDARQTIELDTTPPAAALAIVGRLQKEEEALGRLVETRTLEVAVGGEPVGVQGFHLGLLAVIFASEKTGLLGYAGQGQALSDGSGTVRDTPSAADGYQKAVEILRRRRTPALIDIFLPEVPMRKGGE